MAILGDLDDVFDGDLVIPWRRREWTIKEPPAAMIEELRSYIFTTDYKPSDEPDTAKRLMGPVWDEMIAAGIGWASLMHIGRTVIMHFGVSPDVAKSYWQLGRYIALIDLDEVMVALASIDKE